MLINVSYNTKETLRKIEAAVGKPFTLKERSFMDGIRSPRLFITETSIGIQNLLILDPGTDTCTIELRPKGIIIRLRSLSETYALVVPYYKLRLHKGGFAVYSIFKDHHYIKVRSDTKGIQKFFKKIMDHKLDNSPTSIEDL